MNVEAKWPDDVFDLSDDIFCPVCDYRVSVMCRDSLRVPLDRVLCPRCRGASIDGFYDFCSMTHLKRRKQWECGWIRGAPPPISSECESDCESGK
jgi:hypothetical protein